MCSKKYSISLRTISFECLSSKEPTNCQVIFKEASMVRKCLKNYARLILLSSIPSILHTPTHPIKIKLNKQVTTTILAKLPINSQLQHSKTLAIIANRTVASLGAQATVVFRIMAGATQTITRRLFKESAHSSLAIAERAQAALPQAPKFISQRINIKMEVMDTMQTLATTII